MAFSGPLSQITDVMEIVTPIDSTIKFPEVLDKLEAKYAVPVKVFADLVASSSSSAEVLNAIRQSARDADERMALLKIFRRCVAPVLDTETSKKIVKHPTEKLVETFGMTFKPINKLKKEFSELNEARTMALISLIGEYDTRGQSGYALTGAFFDWFEQAFVDQLEIDGPRGAGKDIELSELFPDFVGSFPCDFVIKRKADSEVLAVGFARYDSTRGGAQSDDRTGGNANKVQKAQAFDQFTESKLKIVFLSDGPGLAHGDTWAEACELDGSWDGRVRVTTLKLAPTRITIDWLESG